VSVLQSVQKNPNKIHVTNQIKSSDSRSIYIPQHHETTNNLCSFCLQIQFLLYFYAVNPRTSAVFSRHAYKSATLMTRRTSRYNKRRRWTQLSVARLHGHRIYSRCHLKTKWFIILLNTLNDPSATWLGSSLLANK
jgi:hypothetical protein